ncbi:MAG: hypothetical protein GXP17_04320 [Gammaproteobacteria bacterium]|nr:hypothetical protein [Gammaproteobacteria bacterium]
MKKFKTIIAIILFVTSAQSMAAYKDSNNVKIKLISVWSQNGNILVQTNPRPDVSDLTCTSDYWITLDKNDPGYQATLSLLLSAQATQRGVNVRVDDSFGSQFCKLTRVITLDS